MTTNSIPAYRPKSTPINELINRFRLQALEKSNASFQDKHFASKVWHSLTPTEQKEFGNVVIISRQS